MTTSTRQPYAWAQLLKAIAIVMVILIHLTAPIVVNWTEYIHKNALIWHIANILNSFSRSSVPLFVMLSGAFLLGKQESIWIFTQKRVSRVLFPWLVAVAALVMIEKTEIATALWSGFWFIPMILGLYCCTPILRAYIRFFGNTGLLALLTTWLLGLLLLWWLDSSFFILEYLGYYVAGYLLNISTHSFTGMQKKLIAGIFFSASICIAISTYVLSSRAELFIDTTYSFTGILTLLASMSLFTWFFAHRQWLETHAKKSLVYGYFLNIGNWSFEIYLIHIVLLRIVGYPT